MANENVPSYITRAKCGCVVGACVDDGFHPEDVKEFLHEAIDDDCTIERVTVGWVREHGLEQCAMHLAESKNGVQTELFSSEDGANG